MLSIQTACAGLKLSMPPARYAVRCGTPMMADPPKIWTPDDILWTPSTFAGTERDGKFGPLTGKYCEDLRQVTRRKTRTVPAGPVKFGSEHPIVRQTMGTTSTKDVKGTIKQIMRCADEGFDLVRITVVGVWPCSNRVAWLVSYRCVCATLGRHEGGDGLPRDS